MIHAPAVRSWSLRHRAPRAGGLGLLALLTACSGNGSDVGPRLDHLSGASHKVLVLDDAGRGVAAARVTIASAVAVTGRSGRGDLLANPTGRQRVQVDASAASATATDRLASMTFAAQLGQDLPFAVFLPDTGASATQTVATGVALASTTLDDTATSGARLVLGAGTVVADTPASVTLRLGALANVHLPGELPAAPSGQHLWTRAIQVEPVTSTFAPAAALEVPDELGLPALASAALYRLDATTGEWTLQPGAATSSGGRLQHTGIAAGGLYAFAVATNDTATLRGRVVDLQNRALAGILVRVDARVLQTDGNGRFTTVVAGALADGTARSVAVDLRGGALWLPVGRDLTTAVLGAGADVDLGDLQLDTVLAGNVRFQVVFAARAETSRRIAFSSLDDATSGTTFTDARGQCTFEDLPAGFYGFLEGRPQDEREVIVAEGIDLFGGGRRWDERRLFFDDREWLIGSRTTRALVVDVQGGGPVRGAVVVRGATPGQGFSGTTREGGVVFVGRSFDGRATATARTVRDGVTTTSAVTIERPNGDHLELPVQRRRREPGGAFDRHGTIAGELTGFVGGATHRLRATRPLQFDEWFDEVLLAGPVRSAVPTRVLTSPPGSFRAGVALPRGHVVALEGTTAAAVFTPTGIAAVLDLEVAEGTTFQRDLPLQRSFAAFTAPQGFAGLDAAIAVADFSYALAWSPPTGLLVDVARDVNGGITRAGNDAVLQLPLLAGDFAAGEWLAALTARSADGKLRQSSLLRWQSPTSGPVRLLPVPTISAPADNAIVPASGFAVTFALPAETLYATIELASPGADAKAWTVVVPPDRTQFDFVALPNEAHNPLVAGRTYSLTLTAYRADEGFVLQQSDPYRELVTYWHTIGAGERGVRALSSRSIAFTTN